MKRTATATLAALIALLALHATPSMADDNHRRDNQQVADDDSDDSDFERQKPKFQTKFFSEN